LRKGRNVPEDEDGKASQERLGVATEELQRRREPQCVHRDSL